MNTRQEAEAKGIPLRAPRNDRQRRAPYHDYGLPGLYMLTFVVKDRQRLLGRLVTAPYVRVEPSRLGWAILNDEIKKINAFYPNVKVWKTCIMPDHIHMIVEVVQPFDEKKHIGTVVAGFKTGCNRAYRRIFGVESGTMFEAGYNDRIIFPGRSYLAWKNYMDDNPRRLAIKFMNPGYFTTCYAVTVCGYSCQSFGNLFLLQIPDKSAVIVHRRYTDEEYARHLNEWMACGERGGVLVGAFIAERERVVLREASARGFRVIQLCDNGFGPYYKPAGRAFDACAEGRLLQLSLWEYMAARKLISRAQCLQLNALAAAIAAPT